MPAGRDPAQGSVAICVGVKPIAHFVAHDATTDHGETSTAMRDIAARALETFLARYAASASDLATVPQDPAQRDALIRFFRVLEALRDVREALARRPSSLAAAVDRLRAECP